MHWQVLLTNKEVTFWKYICPLSIALLILYLLSTTESITCKNEEGGTHFQQEVIRRKLSSPKQNEAVNGPDQERNVIKTGQFSNSAQVFRLPVSHPAPPNLSAIASAGDPVISSKWSLRPWRLLAQGKFAGSGQPIYNVRVLPRSGKPQTAACGPPLRKAVCGKTGWGGGGNQAFNNSAGSPWFIFMFCVSLDAATLSTQQTNTWIALHARAAQGRTGMLCTSPWGCHTGHSAVNVYALPRRDLSW